MPSSISNSKPESFEHRLVPHLDWPKALWLAVLLMAAGLLAWEYNARHIWGYAPEAYIDSKGLWANQRRLLADSDESTVVIIGASRILFDFDLDTYERMTGQRPIQLALAGTNPRPILADLSADENFKGLLYIGITPGSFFRHGGGIAADTPTYFKNQSPSQRFGQLLSEWIEPHLSFYDGENWPLFTLIERIPMSNREGVFDPRMGVWNLSEATRDRDTKMFWKVEELPYYQHKAQMTWRGFMQMSDKRGPAPFDIDAYLAGVIADINAIRSRGGEVIFIRPPSSGDYRPRENQLQPRASHWDRLLQDTETLGVHFEDHPELQGFRLPEWSHLHSEDAPPFTAELVKIIDKQRQAAGLPGIISTQAQTD